MACLGACWRGERTPPCRRYGGGAVRQVDSQGGTMYGPRRPLGEGHESGTRRRKLMGRSFGRYGIQLGRLVAAAALVLGGGSMIALVTASPVAAATTLKVATTGSDTGNCQTSSCL